MSILRDSAIGWLIRAVGGRHLLKYIDENDDFTLPDRYSPGGKQSPPLIHPTSLSEESNPQLAATLNLSSGSEQADKNIIIVTWYSDQDPENPQNWSTLRKGWKSALLFLYTLTAYIGSSVFVASEAGFMTQFDVNATVASLGLALYVFGYGIAPMVLSPLTEIPVLGRNPPYVISFSLFAILTFPVALIDNVAGILVIRFLLGILCSPALSTVGASYGDFYSASSMQFVIALWSAGVGLGPALGPVISGYAVENMGWRWSAWELFWLSAPMAILVICTLPETSSDTILLRRAQRLRVMTGRSNLRSESEIRQAHMSASEITFQALIKPWQINALDPAVLFTTVYLALGYGIYYSFFESFPLVYDDIYHFSLGAMGLAFLSILVGLIITIALLCCYIHFVTQKRLAKMDNIPPEARIMPGIYGSFLIPIGLFLFAWTSRKSVHWIASMFGVGISFGGIILIGQGILIYLPFTYPRYAGSLFAASGLARSLFAGAAVLFSPPMFKSLGVGGGVSLLGGLSAACVAGMFCLYFYGADLRRRSKFAVL